MQALELDNDKTKSFLKDRYIWLLLIISLSVRIYLNFFTYIIKNDSVAFIRNAKYFASGDFVSGLGHDYHPLYSLIMAALYKVVLNMELSGTIASVAFGTLTVIIFYLIGKNIFNEKVSFISSIILAFHPYAVRFSSDIISESTYFFFFISALGLGYFAMTNRKLLLFALTGMSSALAYLTRPEGIGIIIIVVSCCVLKDCTRIKVLWKEKLVSILILVVSFLAFSMPYLVYIKENNSEGTNNWRLTKKKKLTQIASVKVPIGKGNDRLIEEDGDKKKEVPDLVKPGKVLDAQKSNRLVKKNINEKIISARDVIKQSIAAKSGIKTHINCILYIIKKYISTFHSCLFIFFIIGVINWSRNKKERFFGMYIIAITVFYLFILYRLSITHLFGSNDAFMYPSRRHLMPLIIPAIFCVGAGVFTTGTWMHGKFQSSSFIVGFKELLKSTWSIQLIVLIVVVCVLLPKTLKPQRFDKLGLKVVCQWIKENSYKTSPVILGMSPRSAYYAGGEHVQMENVNGALTYASAKNVDYILITYKEFRVLEEELLRSIKGKKIILAYKYPEKEPLRRRGVLLYEISQ